MKQLFEVRAEVDATGKAHPFYAAATVYALVGAGSEQEAQTRLRHDLEADGYLLVSQQIPARQIDPQSWTAYVAEHWAGIASQLPDGEGITSLLQREFLLHLSFYPHE
jgi:hypothetical protein